MIKTISFGLCILFSITHLFSEEKYLIKNLPYTNVIDFSNNADRAGSLFILGWSKNGKILCYITGQKKQVFIMDLVEDIVLCDYDNFHSDNEFMRGNIRSDAGVYGIQAVVSNIGEFPYIDNEKKSFSIPWASDIESWMKRERNTDKVNINIYVYQNFEPFKSKKAATLTITIEDEYITENIIYCYAKSPFEDRLAIIAVIPQIHRETNERRYLYQVFGCHLNVGFVHERDS